ncbi:hypothetical protein BGZ83_002326 [Gryganskiella cystojenkinii]|nr:hypothetical protein BGZ83_002326 [Gryganskiella cystojenkinii]
MSTTSSPSVFNTPELILLIAEHLDLNDLVRFSKTNIIINQFVLPLLWRDYTLNEDDTYNPYLVQHFEHLRTISVTVAYDCDSDFLRVLAGDDKKSKDNPCTSLTSIEFYYECSFEPLEENVEQQDCRDQLIRVIELNDNLTHLSLHSRIIQEFQDEFLDAILCLEKLKSLEVSLSIEDPVFTTAFEWISRLGGPGGLPQIEEILFNAWYGGFRGDDYWLEEHSDESEEMLNERDEEIDEDEERFLKVIRPRIESMKFPRLKRLDLPPRRMEPYPDKFLTTFFQLGFPSLRTLTVPNIRRGATVGAESAIREGCPLLQDIRMTRPSSSAVAINK